MELASDRSQTPGGSSHSAACDYFLHRFTSLNQYDTKQIYSYFTCATDTNQVSVVFDTVNGMSFFFHEDQILSRTNESFVFSV